MWIHNDVISPPVDSQFIEWDLGATYLLDNIHVWNFNAGVPNRSINQVDIYVSTNAAPGDPEGAGAANWSLFAEDATLPVATGLADYVGFDLESLASVPEISNLAARFVRFEVDSNFGEVRVGLSEIQFFGSAAVVPEPSAFGVLGFAFAAATVTITRRRRKRNC